MTDVLEQETRYVKSAQKATPPKADHKHEYFRYVTWNRIRRFNGTVSEEKYKFSLEPTCIDCGHVKRSAFLTAVEIEVSVREFRKLEKESV